MMRSDIESGRGSDKVVFNALTAPAGPAVHISEATGLAFEDLDLLLRAVIDKLRAALSAASPQPPDALECARTGTPDQVFAEAVQQCLVSLEQIHVTQKSVLAHLDRLEAQQSMATMLLRPASTSGPDA